MPRIVVIDDEPDILEVVSFNLEDAGHEVKTATTAAEGLALVRDAGRIPDLVVLDLMLPDGSGLDVCRALREDPRTRDVCIVMLTAKDEQSDRIAGYESGADDYVQKPFSVTELLLRIGAVLRRRRPPGEPPVVEFGPLRVERATRRVWVGGHELALAPLEKKLLLRLCKYPGQVQSYEELLANVFGFGPDASPRALDLCVKRLRSKLGEAASLVQSLGPHGFVFRTRDAS